MKPELKTETGTPNLTGPLMITVLYTTPEATGVALTSAAALAGNLGATIRLVIMRIVPFPLPLNTPPVPIEFSERHARKLARRVGVVPEVQILDCRDREEALLKILPSQSVVVMGVRHRWFPTRQTRLARMLRGKGHEVVLVETAARTKWQA